MRLGLGLAAPHRGAHPRNVVVRWSYPRRPLTDSTGTMPVSPCVDVGGGVTPLTLSNGRVLHSSTRRGTSHRANSRPHHPRGRWWLRCCAASSPRTGHRRSSTLRRRLGDGLRRTGAWRQRRWWMCWLVPQRRGNQQLVSGALHGPEPVLEAGNCDDLRYSLAASFATAEANVVARVAAATPDRGWSLHNARLIHKLQSWTCSHCQ